EGIASCGIPPLLDASKQPFDPRPIALDHIHLVPLREGDWLPGPLTTIFDQHRNQILRFRENEDIRILKVPILRHASVRFSGYRWDGKTPTQAKGPVSRSRVVRKRKFGVEV